MCKSSRLGNNEMVEITPSINITCPGEVCEMAAYASTLLECPRSRMIGSFLVLDARYVLKHKLDEHVADGTHRWYGTMNTNTMWEER